VNRKSNKFVLDMPLDDSLLGPLFETEEKAAQPVGDEVRAALSFGLRDEAASALPIGVAALVIALFALRDRLRPSSRCDRCGRPVCKRCDPDARPSEQLCAQCVNVFVRRGGVEVAERVRKEIAVQAYHRRRRALARLLNVLVGAGHVMIGHPVSGLFFLLIETSLLASIVLWHGVAHGPVAVRSGMSFFRIGLTAAGLIAIYAICLRDLVRRQRSEEGG
jgi:hypothetical protein